MVRRYSGGSVNGIRFGIGRCGIAVETARRGGVAGAFGAAFGLRRCSGGGQLGGFGAFFAPGRLLAGCGAFFATGGAADGCCFWSAAASVPPAPPPSEDVAAGCCFWSAAGVSAADISSASMASRAQGARRDQAVPDMSRGGGVEGRGVPRVGSSAASGPSALRPSGGAAAGCCFWSAAIPSGARAWSAAASLSCSDSLGRAGTYPFRRS